MTTIRAIKNSDIPGLNRLPPSEWDFDFEDFIEDYLKTDYFFAFVLLDGEKVIGTGMAFLKDNIAWLANIIVDGDFRNKGYGSRITKHLIDFLISKGCESQILLATALGEAVYKKLGFEKTTSYLSFDSVTDTDYRLAPSMRELQASDLTDLYQLDQAITGENRRHYLDKFYESSVGYFSPSGELLGCYLPNFSRGLVLAKEEQAGEELLKLKHSKKDNRSMLPLENETGIAFLEELGLKQGVSFSRMELGKRVDWNPQNIYSYGSGYCG